MGVSNILNGAMGLAMLLPLLFYIPNDVDSVLNSETYSRLLQADNFCHLQTYIIIITEIFTSVGALATASRMLSAFAREEGLPGSRYLARVDGRTYLPLYAIGATVLINLLLSPINIGSSVGFGAFISLIVASYYSSFILSAVVMLHKRLTTPANEIPWGPFRLGLWGVPVTVGAIAYSILGTFFSMWPTANYPNFESMNYGILVFGVILLFAGVFWLMNGRKTYTGPVIETTGWFPRDILMAWLFR
ncbi:hypothetical protein HYALB_00008015 [Hymenoscyphus albidus]|uniref:Uncharacterized protein n=1 Tax=Hymenoscyphus albidus TaxID=595503 RepID=A0A9N9LFE0_9HELO|nr:hypothetical protein HYALB_00008015 [Hymenoscyphus albidus]